MTPAELKDKLMAHNISHKMVAIAWGRSTTLVWKALNGTHDVAFGKIAELCTDEWISQNKRPLILADGTSEFDPVKVAECKFYAQQVDDIINSERPLSWDDYQGEVRSICSYINYHYFGLITDVDLMIDESEVRRLCVDHAVSIYDGYRSGLPYWVVASPVNLRVVDDAINMTKGKRSSLEPNSLLPLFNDFITKYPRYWIVIARAANGVHIPKPFSQEERKVSQRFYTSKKSEKTFVDTHKHKWGKGNTTLSITFSMSSGILSVTGHISDSSSVRDSE